MLPGFRPTAFGSMATRVAVGFLVMLELALPLSLSLSLYSEMVVFPLFAMERGNARFKKMIAHVSSGICYSFFHHQDDNSSSSPSVSSIVSSMEIGLFLYDYILKGVVLLTGKKNTRNKPYVPRLKSAAYAIMITLYRYDFFRVGGGGLSYLHFC